MGINTFPSFKSPRVYGILSVLLHKERDKILLHIIWINQSSLEPEYIAKILKKAKDILEWMLLDRCQQPFM